MKTGYLTTLGGLVISAVAFAQTETAVEHAAHAGQDHAHDLHEKAGVVPTISQGIVPMIVSLVVFAAVLAILSAKVWPKVVQGLKDRENKIREEIESAEMARQQAKDSLEQYQQSLSQARAEAQKMIESARQQQAVLSAQLRAQADAELAALRDRARKDIEAAKRAAVAELYNEATSLATLMASKVLKRQVTQADTNALVEESVKQLAALRN